MTKIRTTLALLVYGGLAAAGMLSAADDLPKAETILDKYVEVTGGKAAYAKIHSEITSGTMDFAAMGLKGDMTHYGMEPDKRVTEVNLPGVGAIRDGSNGDVAWSVNAIQGPRLKEGDEKAEALLEAKFNSEAHWRELYKTVETVGAETTDGKDCYKLVLTPKAGNPMTRWYDKQSNLLVKMSMTTKSPMGEIQAESSFSDYRKEGGILVPHKVTSRVAGRELIMTIDKVQHNPEIPKGKFELPDDIKALLKK
jgi:outer membrane lipoprotein-sorting protein